MIKKKDLDRNCKSYAQIMGMIVICFWCRDIKAAFSVDMMKEEISNQLVVGKEDVQAAVDRMQMAGYLEGFKVEEKTAGDKGKTTTYWVLTEKGFDFLKMFE